MGFFILVSKMEILTGLLGTRLCRMGSLFWGIFMAGEYYCTILGLSQGKGLMGLFVVQGLSHDQRSKVAFIDTKS